MKLTQIATLLNDTLVPNYLGEEETISSDLSNIASLGKAIADVDGADLKTYAGDFVAGVAKTWFDNRNYSGRDYGLFIDSREFGGVTQRVKADISEAVASNIWSLESGTDYFDGKYYGTDFNNKVYVDDVVFKVNNSIPSEMYKQAFTNYDDMMSLISLIENRIDMTITIQLETLAKSIYQQIIQNAKEVKLLTIYNANAGTNLTANEFLHNAPALRWAAEQVVRLKKMVRDYNKKYNDGTIGTFTPETDTFVTLLTEFSVAAQFNMEADTFHNDLVNMGQFNEINFWQNASDEILPSLGVTAEVKNKSGEGGADVTKTNVVGVIHDRYTAGMTARLDKVTAQYIASEDYTTYFHHIARSSFVDTRNTAIMLSLT